LAGRKRTLKGRAANVRFSASTQCPLLMLWTATHQRGSLAPVEQEESYGSPPYDLPKFALGHLMSSRHTRVPGRKLRGLVDVDRRRSD
jgi:hypothetical protein